MNKKKTISVAEIRDNIGQILEDVKYNNSSYIITRRGKPYAQIKRISDTRQKPYSSLISVIEDRPKPKKKYSIDKILKDIRS